MLCNQQRRATEWRAPSKDEDHERAGGPRSHYSTSSASRLITRVGLAVAVAGTPGRFYVYAIYCRNDQAMSQTTAWTDATGPTDPRIERLFRELFPVVFSEQQNRWAFNDPMFR